MILPWILLSLPLNLPHISGPQIVGPFLPILLKANNLIKLANCRLIRLLIKIILPPHKCCRKIESVLTHKASPHKKHASEFERERNMWPFNKKGASGFSSSSTAEQVTQGVDGNGLTAIVTGFDFSFPFSS